MEQFKEGKSSSPPRRWCGSLLCPHARPPVAHLETGRPRLAGNQKARFNFDKLAIKKPAVWDGRWHIVFYDIPERKRRARDALRDKLKEMGFLEWQKSVFVHPYPCRDEVEFIIEFFDIRPYVRFGELIAPTNEAELKIHFGLT